MRFEEDERLADQERGVESITVGVRLEYGTMFIARPRVRHAGMDES